MNPLKDFDYSYLPALLEPLGFYPVERDQYLSGDVQPVPGLWHTPYAGDIDFTAVAPDKVISYALRKIRESGIEEGKASVQRQMREALGLGHPGR